MTTNRTRSAYSGSSTVNITEYRNAKDDVIPANNRTLGGFFHDQCPPFTTFEPPEADQKS